jgi:hypothetical protein
MTDYVDEVWPWPVKDPLKGNAMTQPDEVVAKDSGGGFAPHSEGQHAVLCVDVVNLGVNVERFADQEPREVAKVALVFASGEQQEDKSLTLVTTEMTLSANEKANLRKFLESWRGKSYTAEQAEAGLPVSKLYGQAALISVEHVTTRKGRKFAKVISIGPLPKAMTAPPKTLLEQYERPKFLKDKKAQYAAALAAHRASNGDQPEPEYPGDEEDDSDIPF